MVIPDVKIEISANQAKTKLLEPLRLVQSGKRFTIANRGKAVADLIPSESSPAMNAAAAIDRFLAFKKSHSLRGNINIKALIEEGRE